MNDKLKESLSGLGEIAAIVAFIVGLLLFFSFNDWLAAQGMTSASKVFFYFLVLYVGAQFLATIIDFLQGRHKATVKNFFLLWTGYLFMTLIHLSLLFINIPIILLAFVLGPVTFLVGFLSLATLLIAFVQYGLGFDWVAHPPDNQMIQYGIIGLIGSLVSIGLSYYFGSKDKTPIDWIIDFWIDKVMLPAESLYDFLMRYLDK